VSKVSFFSFALRFGCWMVCEHGLFHFAPVNGVYGWRRVKGMSLHWITPAWLRLGPCDGRMFLHLGLDLYLFWFNMGLVFDTETPLWLALLCALLAFIFAGSALHRQQDAARRIATVAANNKPKETP
jgi:hypothetical protein